MKTWIQVPLLALLSFSARHTVSAQVAASGTIL
jgi:hypothetical protein